MKARYLLKSSTLAAGFFSLFLFGGVALASSYEWIGYFRGYQQVTCPSGIPCKFNINSPGQNELMNGRPINLFWGVTTTKPYYEYRSVYYYVTSTPNFIPPANWPTWTEHTECRKNGTVNYNTNDSCTASTTNVYGYPNTIWYRATVNYEGCGTWTPTPETGYCGDYKQASSTFGYY